MILGVHIRIRTVGMQTISPHFIFQTDQRWEGRGRGGKTISGSRGERAWERSASSHPTLSLTHLNAGKNFKRMQSCERKSKLSPKDVIYQERCFLTPCHHLDMTHFKRLSRCITLTVRLQVLSRITTR